jgi:hypothetical protein
MASLNKNFVVKNGLEVFTNLIYADARTNRVGLGITAPEYFLDVRGDTNIVGSLRQTSGTTNLNSLIVQSAVDFNSTLNVDGNTTLNSFLINGSGIFFGGTTFNQDVQVNADQNITGRLTVGEYAGDGSPLVGIVTQIVAGAGISISASQEPGKGVVRIDAFKPIGKTVFVTQNGNDNNSGLTDGDAKRTIKAAAATALTGDTIKVYPGIYVEENPIVLARNVAVEGTELRNCVVTPKYPERDMFYVNNSCHITDMSFIGKPAKDRASVVALQKLLGTKEDRYFDAARMIRFNVDYIATESVKWLHSGYSGFAGNHLEQDAAKKIEANIDYIAAETVGFLTARNVGNGSIGYVGKQDIGVAGTTFVITDSSGNPTQPVNCEDDIKDVLRSLVNDLKAGSNKKSIGAAKSYFDEDTGAFLHINSFDPNGNSVALATVDALNFALGITTHVVNNLSWSASSAVGFGTTSFANSAQFGSRGIYQDFSYQPLIGDCSAVLSGISSNIGIVANTLYEAFSPGNPTGLQYLQNIPLVYGVNLDVEKDCIDDLKSIWQRIVFDLTRGGNSQSILCAKAYYNEDFTQLKPGILKNPAELEQTIATLDYSFNIARSVVNNNSWGNFPALQAGISTFGKIDINDAVYDNKCGILTVFTSVEHDFRPSDAVKLEGLVFECNSGGGLSNAIFPSDTNQTNGLNGSYYGDTFSIYEIEDVDRFSVLVGPSTIAHIYSNNDGTFGPTFSGSPFPSGTVERRIGFGQEFTQIKDLGIQNDVSLGCVAGHPFGWNNSIAGCKNVISSIKSLVGVVTTVLKDGSAAFPGITTTFPGNRGEGISNRAYVTNATYNQTLGKVTVTVPNLNAERGDRIEIRDLSFSCASGGPTSIQKFPSGAYGYEFYIDSASGDDYVLNVGTSTLEHNYEGGGYIVDRTFNVTSAPYTNTTGIVTVTAPGAAIKTGDIVTLRDLVYNCSTGGSATFPNQAVQTEFGGTYYGNNFTVKYITSGSYTDKPISVTNCLYNNITGLTTITAPGLSVSVDDLVEVRGLEFTCNSGAQTTPIYPTGKYGFKFKVYRVVSSGVFEIYTGSAPQEHIYVGGGTVKNVTVTKSSTFTLDVGISTIGHTYVGPSGYIIPPYSAGVGPITQGPYIRNCTNFIANSIGMKVDGFDAEPGFEDDIGVTGTMSVDSYTQYNQGGIGVSITNGGYSQLVSIFTICDDIAIYTGSGGQCDLTNSNASFGNYGLYSDGVGDQNSKSIYHYTGYVIEDAPVETIDGTPNATLKIAGVGTYRPYDGQALYFGEQFYFVERIEIIDKGSGYSALVPPNVTIQIPPADARGVRAEASPNVDPDTGSLTSIDVINSGSQYRSVPIVTIDPPPPGGVQATARAVIEPIYYFIESATLPYNDGVTGISTVVLTQNLNNSIPRDTNVFFTRLSLQIATTISFEWVGAGTDINKAKPALGGVTINENEVVKINGGQVVFTSTNQAGNFRIGTDLTINQLTGTISGRAFSQSLLQTVTPLIIALGSK